LHDGISEKNAYYIGFEDNKITKGPADIIGIHNLGPIRLGFKSSFVIWNGISFH
jgi:hypothetical protein